MTQTLPLNENALGLPTKGGLLLHNKAQLQCQRNSTTSAAVCLEVFTATECNKVFSADSHVKRL